MRVLLVYKKCWVLLNKRVRGAGTGDYFVKLPVKAMKCGLCKV